LEIASLPQCRRDVFSALGRVGDVLVQCDDLEVLLLGLLFPLVDVHQKGHDPTGGRPGDQDRGQI
jgi:hypothetical protein